MIAITTRSSISVKARVRGPLLEGATAVGLLTGCHHRFSSNEGNRATLRNHALIPSGKPALSPQPRSPFGSPPTLPGPGSRNPASGRGETRFIKEPQVANQFVARAIDRMQACQTLLCA